MKKLIRIRILAMLCLFFRHMLSCDRDTRRRMNHLRTENRRMKESMSKFLKHHPPEMVRYFTLLIFQCWAVNDCKMKSAVSDQDFAEFLDQLNEFVSSAYRFHCGRTAQQDLSLRPLNSPSLNAT